MFPLDIVYPSFTPSSLAETPTYSILTCRQSQHYWFYQRNLFLSL